MLLFLYAIPSNAACGMYTYQDMWMDTNGNALGENYTQATGCYGTSTFSEVRLTMPSGYQVAGSATGSTIAEALAQSFALSESGDGFLWGYNEAFSDICDYFDSWSFNFPISIALKTTYGENTLGSQVVLDKRFCGYTPACSNNVTPACGNPSWTDVRPAYLACSRFLRGSFVRVRIGQRPYSCYAFDFDATGPGPCDP